MASKLDSKDLLIPFEAVLKRKASMFALVFLTLQQFDIQCLMLDFGLQQRT